mgnify:FL=1
MGFAERERQKDIEEMAEEIDKMPKRPSPHLLAARLAAAREGGKRRTTPAANPPFLSGQPPERSGIHVRQTGCAICHEKYSVGSILELFLSTHIQSIGDVTYPAKYKGRSVEIHVCMPCFEEQNNLVINSVKNYHQGSDN